MADITAMRPGKTAKDKRTGAWDNRFSNREARISWQKDKSSTNKTFPFHTCNGKKNRLRDRDK
jgi:hypothetical protein